MTRRIQNNLNRFKYKGEPIKITFGTLVLTCFCGLLLIVSTFTKLTITHFYLPLDTMSFLAQSPTTSELAHHFIKTYKYIPQIPMVFFIVALLGRKFGILTLVGYIFLGMFFPIFALGGGFSYIFEYSFGYILAYIPAIFCTGTLLKIKTDFLRILMMATLGVLTIHILGILYMLFIETLRHIPMSMIIEWISLQSCGQILYDIFFTVLAIYMGRWARRLFWIIMC